MQSEKVEVALRVLRAIDGHTPVSEKDAFQLRFWVSPDEALLSLDEIARRIRRHEFHGDAEDPG